MGSRLFWVALVLVITGSAVARTGTGNWAWRAGGRAATVFDGVPLEWEWFDVAQTAWFVEGNPRWPDRGEGALMSQNGSRFIPGIAVAWLGVWLRDARRAAIVATWFCWIAAAVACYGLGRALGAEPDRGRRVGQLAATLVALSPGLAAFTGNIDAHPFGYAAAPVALLLTDRIWRAAAAADPARGAVRKRLAVLVGGIIFVAGGTMEIAPILLTVLWLVYVPFARVARCADRRPLAGRAWDAALATGTYAALQSGWWLTVYAATLGLVRPHNEAIALANEVVGSAPLSALTLGHLALGSLRLAAAVFTPPVAIAFVVGLLVLPARSRWWTLVWVLALGVAVTITRNHPRTLYLLHPAVYVAAAAGAEWLGALAAAALGGPLRRFPEWQSTAIGVVRWLPAIALCAVVARLVLADLAGDLSLVRLWWD